MTIHKEGKLLISIGSLDAIIMMVLVLITDAWWAYLLFLLSVLFLIFCVHFFRYPERKTGSRSTKDILAPADGKIVVNEVREDGRRQLSIFMSPLNVHAQWTPVSGEVVRSEYFPGKYLVAWHPKSSEKNERHEVDILTPNGHLITTKQIAGAVARRIRCYVNSGEEVKAGDELGFIKFGSRVDVLLPKESIIHVHIGDRTQGREMIIASLD